MQVVATVLRPGVLRCRIPPHEAGPVSVTLTLGDSLPCSQTVTFTYRITPHVPRAADDRCVDILFSLSAVRF